MNINNLPKKCVGEIKLHVPEKLRRGSQGVRANERKGIESAVAGIKTISELTGYDDWSRLKVLDYGCGVKFTQAMIQYDIAVASYTGMDVFRPMIDYLNQNIDQPNFRYFVVPFQNDRYNPDGDKLVANAKLPGKIKAYDLFILQSVFTHFAPNDFQTLLLVLRNHASVDARMYFTCFINNDIETNFLDSVKDRPLLRALYRESAVREMLDNSYWEIVSLDKKGFRNQHQIICKPIQYRKGKKW